MNKEKLAAIIAITIAATAGIGIAIVGIVKAAKEEPKVKEEPEVEEEPEIKISEIDITKPLVQRSKKSIDKRLDENGEVSFMYQGSYIDILAILDYYKKDHPEYSISARAIYYETEEERKNRTIRRCLHEISRASAYLIKLIVCENSITEQISEYVVTKTITSCCEVVSKKITEH